MKIKHWRNLTDADKALLMRRNRGVITRVARTLDVSEGLVSRVWWDQATSARILTEILSVVKP